MSYQNTGRIIDLSHPLGPETPAFPGDPPPEIRILDSTELTAGDGQRHLNSSHLSASLHCGTHMDAPFHFFAERATIDRVPLARTIGRALLVRLPWQTHGRVIDLEQLAEFESRLRDHERVVFDTHWHHRWGEEDYFTEHPVLTGRAARLLVDCGLRLVGVDTPSVDRSPFEAHLALLGADVLIVENLTNLREIPGDEFELVATPLAIVGRDGSPVRAVARV